MEEIIATRIAMVGAAVFVEAVPPRRKSMSPAHDAGREGERGWGGSVLGPTPSPPYNADWPRPPPRPARSRAESVFASVSARLRGVVRPCH